MCEIKAIVDKIHLHPNQTLIVKVPGPLINIERALEVFKANLPKNAKCIIVSDDIRMKVIGDTYDLTRGLDPLDGYVEGTLGK